MSSGAVIGAMWFDDDYDYEHEHAHDYDYDYEHEHVLEGMALGVGVVYPGMAVGVGDVVAHGF